MNATAKKVPCLVCGLPIRPFDYDPEKRPAGMIPLHGYRRRGATNSNGCVGSGFRADATREEVAAYCDRRAASEAEIAAREGKPGGNLDRSAHLHRHAEYWRNAAKSLRAHNCPVTIKQWPGMGGAW